VISLVWHRGRHRSPASIAFVDLARDVCAGLRRGAAVVASRPIA
jgi:DNA-binding transcriptional LysR family regulator